MATRQIAQGGSHGGAFVPIDVAHLQRQGQLDRCVADVWSSNLDSEMKGLRDAIQTHQYVAVEVLLPEPVAEPTGPFGDYTEYNYQMLRCNVDLLRALRVVFTLSDAKGNRPNGVATWQFNLHFDPQKDVFLQATDGIDKEKHSTQGILALKFGELLMTSGLVLCKEVKWVVFGGPAELAAGPPARRAGPVEPQHRRFCGMYSFGYLLQLLTCVEMPDTVQGFAELLALYFPCRCDLSEHLYQLPQPGGLDPANPQRPWFCSSQSLLDGFFHLPEASRKAAFDRVADGDTKALQVGHCGSEEVRTFADISFARSQPPMIKA